MAPARGGNAAGIVPVRVPSGDDVLDGDLTVPRGAGGLVIFAHGSGSSRFSGRNRAVAAALQREGFATLLLDLLTPEEERVDVITREFRFDMPRLGERVVAAVDWATADPRVVALPLALFGASTGAAAALMAAAERPRRVAAVISRGGRPDLAAGALLRVQAPTLLIVGALDEQVIALNERARRAMPGLVDLVLVPGATHLFEEPGTLDEVTRLAAAWCRRWLGREG